MSPRDRRTRSTPAQVARVRTLLEARMPWLPGFPDPQPNGRGLRWRCGPGHQAIALTGRELSRATRLVRELMRDHPVALARLVGDADAWSARTLELIDLVKPAVHGRGPVPASLFDRSVDAPLLIVPSVAADGRALTDDHPALAPLVAALSWLTAGDRRGARRALRIVGDWRDLLARLLAERGLRAVLDLWRLADEEGPKRVAPLLALIVDPRAHRLTTNARPHLEEIARAVERDEPLPDPPAANASLADGAAALARRLLGWDRQRRRRALGLFAAIIPDPGLDRWAAWWIDYDQVRRDIRRKLARRPPRATRRWIDGLLKPQKKLRDRMPPVIDPTALFAAVDRLSEPGYAAWFPAMRGILAMVPPELRDRALPLAFAEQWCRILHQSDEVPARRFGYLFTALRAYLRRAGTDERALRPWDRIIDAASGTGWLWSLDDNLLEELARPADWARFFDAVVEIRDERAALDLDLLARLAARSATAGAAIDATKTLMRAGLDDSYVDDDELDLALRLAGGDDDQLAAIMTSIVGARDYERDNVRSVLSRMADLFEKAGALPELALLMTSDGHRTLDAAAVLSLAQRLGVNTRTLSPPAPARELPAFAARLPERFHRAARVLAGAHPDPRKAMHKVLGKDLPDPKDLKAELATVEKKLATTPPDRAAALVRHLASVRRRIAAPRPVSEARLARLADKLDATACRALLDGWQRRVGTELTAALADRLGAEALQPWMQTRETVRIIDAALALRGSRRALALRLLRLRAGPPPWDLRDAPENRAFLDRLRALGVDPAPWVDGIGTMKRRAGNHVLSLALTDDPLEIFWMGAHFGTCLSPGAMNFFSVFSNAADINKRVLYARNPDGSVAGRCLLALTGEGSILTFHAYRHDNAVDMGRLVADFAGKLADAMGTRMIARGMVPTLVATDWYDDGPVDLTGAVGALAEGGLLRAALGTLAPERLVGHLEAALGAPLDDYTLLQITALPELASRPELILPLVPHIERCRALPIHNRIHAGWLAHRAGDAEAVRRITGNELEPYVTTMWRQQFQADNAAELLLALSPQRLLRALRRSRERGVRSLTDEPRAFRLLLAARACEQLHRRTQARRLFERVAAVHHTREELRQARQGLSRLQSV